MVCRSGEGRGPPSGVQVPKPAPVRRSSCVTSCPACRRSQVCCRVIRVAAGHPVPHMAAEMGGVPVDRAPLGDPVRHRGGAGTDRPLQPTAAQPDPDPGRDRDPGPAGPARSSRAGLDRRGAGLPASTVGRILRRHRVPLLRDLDRLTGSPSGPGSWSCAMNGTTPVTWFTWT